MTDIEKLRQDRNNHKIICPGQDRPTLANLGAYLHPPSPQYNHSKQLEGLLANGKKPCLLLIDGLGWSQVQQLATRPLFRNQPATFVDSVFPSATACGVTSLATGMWPGQHGINGWWTYIPETSETVLSLIYCKRNLKNSYLNPKQSQTIYPQAPLKKDNWLQMLPLQFLHSPYTKYSSSGAQLEGYQNYSDIISYINLVKESFASKDGLHIYLPELDEISHHFGPLSNQAFECFSLIEKFVEALRAALPNEYQIISCADHGHIGIEDHGKHMLKLEDPLRKFWQRPPTGEPMVSYMHIKPGLEKDFTREFQKRFHTSFYLISLEEAEAFGLFGPEPIPMNLRPRFGSMIAIAKQANILVLEEDKELLGIRGIHGGLSPEEVMIPVYTW